MVFLFFFFFFSSRRRHTRCYRDWSSDVCSSDLPQRLYGRGQEQQRIDLLIGAARSRRSGALIVRGEVGTGKSALLSYALAKAADLGVLSCRGDRAESGLPFAALHQLLARALPFVRE